MKIRSITFFTPQVTSAALDAAAELRERAMEAFTSAGYEVQTSRLATIPFPVWMPDLDRDHAIQASQELEAGAVSRGFDYISIGPALPSQPESYALIPEILAASKQLFTSGLMTHRGTASLPAIQACAEIIHHAATIAPDGFANLRFCASANLQPGTPFFPASYHDPAAPALSLALAVQSADLAVDAFRSADDLAGARQSLITSLEGHGRALQAATGRIAGLAAFGGIDFSLAPFPAETESIGAALESLGLPALGLHGSLAAAAFLADTIDRADFARTGFSGLMLPVLEDPILAARAADGTLTVTDLLLYSAVCGTGLDTIPLPGDTSPQEMYPVLLDLTALALRLNKPLTARLMPIPGKRAGDATDFDFAFFANSRVMALRSAPLIGLFQPYGAELSIRPRPVV